MLNSNIIEIENLSMCFSLADNRVVSLKEFITKKTKGEISYSKFWALKDITCDIRRGEVVGIIGRNGSGKSTLLKIISGILKPTNGTVSCNGNIAPMLELGSGFDHDLTGRENVYLNGAILGYNKAFLEEMFDEILTFSELGEFIDVPIRNYSSGMIMRLAFSIATLVEPEILIVDEILSVGDDSFQKKSENRMLEMMGGGTTVLVVSHSINQIRELCNRVIWLDAGKIKMVGSTNEVCDAYLQGR